jgi:TetR/AcrR family transcriptional repressor of nem operon
VGRTSDARERLVEAAAELMLARGYGALGVADICARADVRKGSFYHFFESKQALTIAAITAHWHADLERWQAVLTADAPALDRLRRLLQTMAEVQCQAKAVSGGVTGCLLGNLALELSAQDPTVRDCLAGIFDEQVTLVEAALVEAGDTIRPDLATTATARSIIAQIEGAVLLAKVYNDTELLDHLWPQTTLLLGIPDTAVTPTLTTPP